MSRITINFRSDQVWDQCDLNGIDPNAFGKIQGWVSKNFGLWLRDSAAGAGQALESFVLFSPNLANKTISRLLTVRKRKRVPSGFLVDQARFYENVYVVDPNGDISNDELLPLVEDEVNVVRVTGGTAREMRAHLEELLSE